MRERIDKMREALPKHRIDNFIVFRPSQIRYLTGLEVNEELDAYFLALKTGCRLVTDFRYEEKAFDLAKKSGSFEVVIPEGTRPRLDEVIRILKNKKRIGFDSNLHFRIYKKLKDGLSGRLIPVGGLLEKISAVKDENEVGLIKRALAITEEVFENRILPIIKPGLREVDLAAEISYWHKKCGAEGDSFSPIVLGGKRSSLPHGTPGNYKLRKGDILQFDMGCIFEGYCSDFSRAVIVGRKATPKQEMIYKTVLAAQEKAIAAARPRMKCRDLDAAARDFITSMGYGDYFRHSLGHGVGIEIHVLPNLAKDNGEPVLPGYVITVEPGIYIPGWGGIRIEDMIWIRDDGVELLTGSPKKLISAG